MKSLQANKQTMNDLKDTENAEQRAEDKLNIQIMCSKNKEKAQNAFNKLYSRYQYAIFYKILRMVKNNRELAEDLTQDVFAKLYTKAHTYNEGNAFSTWFYNIAISSQEIRDKLFWQLVRCLQFGEKFFGQYMKRCSRRDLNPGSLP